MSVREKILKDIYEIENNDKLNEIYNFIKQVNNVNEITEQKNSLSVMQLRGSLSNKDAQEMMAIVSNEFSNIEGDWE